MNARFLLGILLWLASMAVVLGTPTQHGATTLDRRSIRSPPCSKMAGQVVSKDADSKGTMPRSQHQLAKRGYLSDIFGITLTKNRYKAAVNRVSANFERLKSMAQNVGTPKEASEATVQKLFDKSVRLRQRMRKLAKKDVKAYKAGQEEDSWVPIDGIRQQPTDLSLRTPKNMENDRMALEWGLLQDPEGSFYNYKTPRLPTSFDYLDKKPRLTLEDVRGQQRPILAAYKTLRYYRERKFLKAQERHPLSRSYWQTRLNQWWNRH